MSVRFHLHRWVLCMAALGLCGRDVTWAEEPSVTNARQREIWIPEKSLPHILAENPKAVVLTREEYKTLIKEAGTPIPPEKITPPTPTLLRSAEYRGQLLGETVLAEATFTFECLSTDLQQWQTLPLPLDLAALSNVKVDEQTALRVMPSPPPNDPAAAPECTLLVRTPGLHTLTANFFLPVTPSSQGGSIKLPNPRATAGQFILTLPERYNLQTEHPFSSKAIGNGLIENTLALPAVAAPLQVHWRARDIAPLAGGAVLQTCSYLYHLDPVRVTSDLGIVLRSALARVPQQIRIPLPPDAKVLSVDGPDVKEWALEEQALAIQFTQAELRETNLRVLLETTPTSAAGSPDLTSVLPQLAVSGLHRASGAFAIMAAPDVRVRRITTSGLNAQTTAALPGDAASQPGFVAGFTFAQLADPPVVTFQPLKPRFQADQLTHLQLRRDAIEVIRTIRILVKEGQIFTTTLKLPPGEEIIHVALENGTEPVWKSTAAGAVEITWPVGVTANREGAVTLTTRMDPEGWFTLGETPRPLKFASATLEGPELTTGYVALDFDDRFHVSTTTATGLEPTDPARLIANGIALTGRMMWNRAEEFTLDLAVSRRPSEVHANITAAALPLLHSCEIEGQIELDVRNSGVRQLLLAVPPSLAESLRFDSPLIAERKLQPLTGEWTLTFHEELSGRPQLRFHWSLPFGETKPGAAPPDASGQRFAITLPVIKLPEAGRTTGTWIIEANTDTELAITAKGLDDLDTLKLPGIAGYAPQHRVIAAYSWRGTAWQLALEGTRHPTAPLPGLVVDDLKIRSALSTDGSQRHQLIFNLRSNGEQFFTCPLPQSANILSLLMDGVALKPVADPVLLAQKQNSLRVQLPATIESRPLQIKLTYELPNPAWNERGSLELTPPALPPQLPVLNTQWDVHLPDGYTYADFESSLEPAFTLHHPVLTEVLKKSVLGEGVSDAMEVTTYASRKPNSTSPLNLPQAAPALPNAEMAMEEKSADKNLGDQAAVPAPQAASAGMAALDVMKSTIIPKLSLNQATIEEAFGSLKAKMTEADPNNPGINFVLQLRGKAGVPITLELSNVPVIVALDQITSLAGLAYRIESHAVVIADPTEAGNSIESRVFHLPAAFHSAAGTDDSDPTKTQQVLTSLGANFEAPGSSATILPGSNTLVVKNTLQQINFIKGLVEDPKETPDNSSLDPFGNTSKIAGLIPLDIDLPTTGRTFTFRGQAMPGPLKFHYASWQSDLRISWLWMLAGAAAAYVLARRRPIFLGVLVALPLGLLPNILGSAWQHPCNALLLGWLAACGFAFLHQRLLRRCP